MSQRQFFQSTRRDILLLCPKCSSTHEIDGPINAEKMREHGFELVDSAWTGLCEECYGERVDASNAEFEALAIAAAQLGRIDKVSPLAQIEIPAGEGFEHEGETLFGFWAVSGNWTDASFERFRRTARLIVDLINEDRGTELLVNVNGAGTQAIVHGVVD